MGLSLSTFFGHIASSGDSGTTPAATTETCPWIALIPTTDFSTTASDDHTIGFFTNQTQVLRDGLPIRVLDRAGVEYGDIGLLSNYQQILGIVPAILDWEGRIYIKWVDEGLGSWHLEFYNNVALTAASQIGHTLTFSGPGDSNIVADNGSGLGGTLSVLMPGAGAPTTVTVEFYKWYVAQAFIPSGGGVGGILLLNGPALSTGAGNITQCWWSCPARVMEMHDFFPGEIPFPQTYLLSNQQEVRKWNASHARLVHFHINAFDVEGEIPIRYLNLLIGDVFTKSNDDGVCTSNVYMGLNIPDGAGGLWLETVVDLDPARLRTLRHDELEWIKSNELAEASTIEGLTCEATWVLE